MIISNLVTLRIRNISDEIFRANENTFSAPKYSSRKSCLFDIMCKNMVYQTKHRWRYNTAQCTGVPCWRFVCLRPRDLGDEFCFIGEQSTVPSESQHPFEGFPYNFIHIAVFPRALGLFEFGQEWSRLNWDGSACPSVTALPFEYFPENF